jgi:hypothetical protein
LAIVVNVGIKKEVRMNKQLYYLILIIVKEILVPTKYPPLACGF